MTHLTALGKALITLTLMLVALGVLGLLSMERRARFKRWLTRAGLWVLGMRVTQEGTLTPGPALIVSNHSSYMDIILLQSLAEMSFTPKSDIASWPLIGGITSRFDAVYVERTPGRTRAVTETLLEHLHRGRRICIFPEATTNDGREMKPFRSSLFALAEAWDGAEPLKVQPVTIRYERLAGRPLDDATWPQVAWYGEASLFPHLWQAFHHRDLEVRAICHEPLTLLPGQTRKELAQQAERVIRDTLFPPLPEKAA